MVYRVRGDRSDEVVYARYRIAVISGHIYNDSLWDISKRLTTSRKDTGLDEKKKANVRGMEEGDCDVAGLITLSVVTLADKRHALCDVANDGWLDFDGLGVSEYEDWR